LKESNGDRRLQLERRLNEEKSDGESAEKLFLRNVWWPVYETLEDVIPEFEVMDGLGKVRSLDHAIVRYPKLVDLEVDGYGPHQKNASRWTFADDRRRDAGLRLIGWDILRFAYSDVKENPSACQYLLKAWMARYEPLTREEEWTMHVVRLGTYHSEFTLADVMQVLRVSEHLARAHLRTMMARRIVIQTNKGMKRIHCYSISEEYLLRNKPAIPYYRN